MIVNEYIFYALPSDTSAFKLLNNAFGIKNAKTCKKEMSLPPLQND